MEELAAVYADRRAAAAAEFQRTIAQADELLAAQAAEIHTRWQADRAAFAWLASRWDGRYFVPPDALMASHARQGSGIGPCYLAAAPRPAGATLGGPDAGRRVPEQRGRLQPHLRRRAALRQPDRYPGHYCGC